MHIGTWMGWPISITNWIINKSRIYPEKLTKKEKERKGAAGSSIPSFSLPSPPHVRLPLPHCRRRKPPPAPNSLSRKLLQSHHPDPSSHHPPSTDGAVVPVPLEIHPTNQPDWTWIVFESPGKIPFPPHLSNLDYYSTPWMPDGSFLPSSRSTTRFSSRPPKESKSFSPNPSFDPDLLSYYVLLLIFVFIFIHQIMRFHCLIW